jgi:hypothetical protein
MIDNKFTDEEIAAAAIQLLALSAGFYEDVIANNSEWAQSVALMLQCELNRRQA